MNNSMFKEVVELIKSTNSEDPNQESDGEKSWPKELLYTHRMAEMLERYSPDADNVMKLAIQSQHIQRWQSPRNSYPMNKKGYYQWRTNLYQFHADTLATLMQKVDCSKTDIDRAKQAVGKKSLKNNPDTQLLEDVSALVFIEHYMQPFVDKHPEYDEKKWISIILRTWNKVSETGKKFALSGAIKLPEPLIPIITKAIS